MESHRRGNQSNLGFPKVLCLVPSFSSFLSMIDLPDNLNCNPKLFADDVSLNDVMDNNDACIEYLKDVSEQITRVVYQMEDDL